MQQANSPALSGRHFHNASLFSAENLLFSAQDLETTCRHVGKIFKPHVLKISEQRTDFSASMHHVKSGGLSINRLEYSADVCIEPDFLDQFYLIQIPTSGYAEIEFAQQKFISYAQVASLISPNQPLKMRWHANSPQLILKIDQQDFAQHCRQHLPDGEHTLPIFQANLDFSTQSGGYFLQLLRTLMDALACDQHPLHHPMAFKQFESNLLNALIYGQPNNTLAKIDAYKDKAISPYFIKRAEAYMREHLHEALNVEILAEQAGVSVRTLFAGFKNFLSTTPMAHLKELRFEQAHLELIRNEQLSVTEVAFKWGFTHLGRFSQEYKRRYGELPSSTRRFTVYEQDISTQKCS